MGQLTFQSLCRKLESRSSLKSYTDELNTLTGAIASLIENPVAGSIGAFIKALAEKEKLISLGGYCAECNLETGICGRLQRTCEADGGGLWNYLFHCFF